MSECPARDEVLAYLEGELAAAERTAVEEHLSRCAACRGRLVELHDERRDAAETHRAPPALKRAARHVPARHLPRRRAMSRRALAAGLSAAAALLLAVLLVSLVARLAGSGPGVAPGRPDAPSDASDVVRSAVAGPLELLAPADGATVGPGAFELRFAPAPGARGYTVTVLDARGEIAWRESTASKSTASKSTTSKSTTSKSTTSERLRVLPERLAVAAGAELYWYVTARLEDGGEIESAVGRFSLGPAPRRPRTDPDPR